MLTSAQRGRYSLPRVHAMKVAIKITCDLRLIPLLKEIGARGRFEVEQSGDDFLLVSSDICPEEYSHYEQLGLSAVWSSVRAWTEALSGALVVARQAQPSNVLLDDCMVEDHQSERRWLPVGISGELITSGPRVNWDPAADVATWTEVAASIPVVGRVLSELSHEPTWVSLYRVYELIRDDVGQNGRLGGVTRSQLDAFRASANRYDVSGRHARHSVPSGEPPRHTLTLVQSRELITRWAEAWLRIKADALP